MSEIACKQQEIIYDGVTDMMYTFKFFSKGTGRDKIVIQKSQIEVFQFCLDNCKNFHDGTRTIAFTRQENYTNMTIQKTGANDMVYRLYDSEKSDWQRYLVNNNLL